MVESIKYVYNILFLFVMMYFAQFQKHVKIVFSMKIANGVVQQKPVYQLSIQQKRIAIISL